jgi:hypothetical protein
MRIGKEVTGRFHHHMQVMCGLEQMIEDDVMTKFDVLYGLEQM